MAVTALMLIDGHDAGAERDPIAVRDPATLEDLGAVAAGTAEDVDRAVRAAERAQDAWRFTSAWERAELLHGVAQATHDHADALLDLLTREQGKPRPEQEEELEWAASTFRYYAELGRHGQGRVVPSAEPRTQLNLVVREPYGVVACIVPWNYPLLLLAWKVAPALAAGNAVVIKPSELTSLATLAWVRAAFAHLPAGLVNVVTGYGDPVGEALVAHPGTQVVAFTGSVATGQRIASVAAPMMKHLHLELGGKDAFLVAPDADLDAAADALAYAGYLNAGQVCTSSERVYVPRARVGEFAGLVAERAGALRVGPGTGGDVDMGPMIGERYRAKVQGHIADATSRGARLVAGGDVPDTGLPGWFLAPTVLANADHSMEVMREETFGPVIPIMGYDSIDEAISLVNDSPYGLGATIRSGDTLLVKRFADEVRAGTIWVNDPLTDNMAGPFGGMKLTGGGRELGQDGLDAFLQSKHVHWDLSQERKDWWYPY
ncbi:MAG: aldehyde dehydrogenase family protein [Actinomycetota bacterium]